MTPLIFSAAFCWVVAVAGAVSPPFIPVPPNQALSPCPPQDSNGYFCDEQCTGDVQCGPNRYCCQVACGNTCMERYQQQQSPKCPPPDPRINCFVFLHQCNNDDQCSRNGRPGLCCLEPACGRHCVDADTTPIQPYGCPNPNSFGRFCFVFRNQCDSHRQCQKSGRGRRCCLVAGCGRECM
ncbi:perlwapin [Procambarus clarkii]|uniref:Triple WAP domain containing protein n=1 Tax=Procambarus clarkii TaxID=6728 RepID=A0A5J6DEU3_PROCL|nr:WAP four-disulfide core domain protein 3-like [Procambarus clarkii]QER91040.1 triple WAP domain containing protein [Procambarus clarkii]